MKTTFQEEYEVNFDYKKPDGYWVCSYKEKVRVETKHGKNEKNNHDKAAEIIKKRYPESKINNVTYQ